MLVHKTETRQGIEATALSSVEIQSRTLNRFPEVIESALRRIVHDYVSGWGIVLTHSIREQRRKKQIWNRRASERLSFSRPVWVHKAQWADVSSPTTPTLFVSHGDENSQDGMFLVHDLSPSGIGLTSDRVPKSRLIVLEFDSWKGRPVEIVLYLRWRRRVATQNYRCGGSILGVLMPE